MREGRLVLVGQQHQRTWTVQVNAGHTVSYSGIQRGYHPRHGARIQEDDAADLRETDLDALLFILARSLTKCFINKASVSETAGFVKSKPRAF